ncbi:MAG: hypothetical protein ACQESO_05580 [Bacillota bacterium]
MEEDFKHNEAAGRLNSSLEELLKSADFKDQVIANFENLEPEKARELARIILWSDSAFSFGLLGKLPHGLNYSIAFLDELGRQLQNVPPELLRKFAAEMGRNIDTESILALPRAYAPLFARLGLAAGEDKGEYFLSREKKIEYIQDKLAKADFGKIRRTIIRQSEEHYPLIESIAATIVSDPVIFANLINIIPPLMNNFLKGTAAALEKVDYPPEILASSIFNLADEIKAEELGAIINRLNRLINGLHEGSAILGGNEPRFRRVLQSFLEKASYGIDEKEAAAALLALGEDLEVIFCVVADTAVQRPELLAELVSAFLQGSSSALRGLTYLLDQLNELPPQLFADLTREIATGDCKESARLLNSLVCLSNRILAENPSLLEKTLISHLQSVDRAELQNFFHNITAQAASFTTSEEFLELLPPEEAAEAFNSFIISYNRKLKSRPPATGKAAAQFLEQIDRKELSTAILLTSDRIAETLAENPGLSRPFISSFFKIIWGAIKGSLKSGRKAERRHG